MLKVRNIKKAFDMGTELEKTVIESLDLDLEKGDFVTIIGSNGAGKSTLLNCISGNLELDGGSVTLDGKDISNAQEYKRAKDITRVFQNPLLGTCGDMTVEENLSIALNRGEKAKLKSGKRRSKIIYDALKELNLGLEDRMQTKVSLLSGGQRQAVSLLMATIKNPKLLLLDEHTSALDPQASAQILESTKKIVETQGITTLMITHNMNDAIAYGNRLIMMRDGQVIYDVKGKEKMSLTQDELVAKFRGCDLSDRMILSA